MWGPIIRGALWIAGGQTVAKVIDETGDTAQQIGTAAQQSRDVVKLAVIGGSLFMAYKAFTK
jgi:hypothetical protein